jgi:outer membrane lipoprotein-sorting protein
MLEAAFLIAQLSTFAEQADPLEAAIESYKSVNTYTVTLRSETDGKKEVIRYYYKRPNHVRMEFIKPHKGVVLVYNPAAGKVRVRPLGFLKPLVLSFSPDNRLLGTLLKAAKDIKSHGKQETLGTEKVKTRETLVITVTGDDGYTVYGEINRYIIWLDKELNLPVKGEAFGVEGELVERVFMDDLEVGMEFEEGFFELD